MYNKQAMKMTEIQETTPSPYLCRRPVAMISPSSS